MKIEEFNEATREIERFYQKEITEEQKQVWFKELRNLNIARFKYIIAQVYRTSKFLPKLADIIEINTTLGYSQVKKETEHRKCTKCNGTGYIQYIKEIEGVKYNYGAICSCRQKQKYEGWKITDEKNESNNYIPYIEEINIGG